MRDSDDGPVAAVPVAARRGVSPVEIPDAAPERVAASGPPTMDATMAGKVRRPVKLAVDPGNSPRISALTRPAQGSVRPDAGQHDTRDVAIPAAFRGMVRFLGRFLSTSGPWAQGYRATIWTGLQE